MTVETVPSFSRLEISVKNKTAITMAALELKQLAGELEHIAGQTHPHETAMILAHHKIRATSSKLRGN